jgi:rare lipoprotein A
MSRYRKDGPPPFPVDETKIPNAVPHKEKLSRIGNKPYVVKGKPYYVMKSSKNFVEVGIASWYGTMFHDQRTSNGEKYDMLAMTAAHKHLPLPTYVQVTNLENHRKIIVKVNDRGPFKPNRIIDLSYVAAKKLHMTGKGTALVEVRAIDTNPAHRSRNLKPRPIFHYEKKIKTKHIHTEDYIETRSTQITTTTAVHRSKKIKTRSISKTRKAAHTAQPKKGVKHVG